MNDVEANAAPKPVSPERSLLARFPDIAAQAHGWDPATVSAGAEIKLPWKCNKGHVWETYVHLRRQGRGCPFCKGMRLLTGFNDLATVNPAVAAEAYGWDPTLVSAKSHTQQTWRCAEGHIWNGTVAARVGRGRGCPKCSRVTASIAQKWPEIAALAYGWDPTVVPYKSTGAFLWRCTCGHTETTTVETRRRRQECTDCFKKQRKGALVSDIPELAAEAFDWNPFTVRLNSTKPLQWKCKNGHIRTASPVSRMYFGRPTMCRQCPEYLALRRQSISSGKLSLAESHPEVATLADGWDPTDRTLSSSASRAWKCARGHTWSASIESVLARIPQGCTQCGSGRGLHVGANDLATVHPEIAAQAHEWDPATVTSAASRKREWICEAGHIWEARVCDRAAGSGCPKCKIGRLRSGNDLKSRFPEIAAEADGWDPSTIAAKSGERLPWKCTEGHTWEAQVNSRVNGYGKCRVCNGKRLPPAHRSLKTLFPQIAAEADGWDPSTVFAKSNRRLSWKCSEGHTWEACVDTRTKGSGKCPKCDRKPSPGSDLKTTFPEIAAQADGWDPSTVFAKSRLRLSWKCSEGHTWEACVDTRTKGSGKCPKCDRKPSPGSDLKTLFPQIAAEADGWDPSTVAARSHQRLPWKCCEGHTWEARVRNRTRRQGECPKCDRKPSPGSDLKTLFPEIAAQADGWDPSAIFARSNKRLSWKCDEGHTWEARVSNRTRSTTTGCPQCNTKKPYPGRDLLTRFPEIAAQADGWDPSAIFAKSHLHLSWKCDAGHTWEAEVRGRANGQGRCPECNNRYLRPGKDLKSVSPEVAAEADGWDPSTVPGKSRQHLPWKCSQGHTWEAQVASRANGFGKCRKCSKERARRRVSEHVNSRQPSPWPIRPGEDLKSRFPEIAAEADGWDPATVAAKSGKRLSWKCSEGHTWEAPVHSRANGYGKCRECKQNRRRAA